MAANSAIAERRPGDQARESMNRIVRSTRELTSAQYTLALEWIQLPLWFTQTGSPQRLQRSYLRLVEASNELFSAYAEATGPLATAFGSKPERSGSSVRSVPTRSSTGLSAVAPAAPVAQVVLRAVPGEAAQAASVVEAAASRVADAGSQSPAAAEEPTRIVNVQSAENIYRLPGAGLIKGKIARDGTKIYHMPGQANYSRFEPDATFESESQARAAGYRAAQR